MSTRTESIGRVRGRLKGWTDGVERLDREARKEGNATREDLNRHLRELEARRQEVGRHLLRLEEAADEAAWEEMQRTLDEAVHRFDHAINRAFAKFRT